MGVVASYDKLLRSPTIRNIAFFFQLALEAVVCVLCITRVPYNNIDFSSYMQQVGTFLDGERNYYNIKGDTGPIVYPAGHVYIFSLFYKIANNGSNIPLMRWIFGGIYILQLILVRSIYKKTHNCDPFMLGMLSLSGRLHKLFMVSCFNDGIAMCLAFASFAFAIREHWIMTCVIFSLAVSVKMSVLLFAPGLLFLLWRASNGSILGTVKYLSICASVQLILGIPFLTTHPIAYLHRSFEFDKGFDYLQTVNWSFLPEWLFVSKLFARFLLMCHLAILFCFFYFVWRRIPKEIFGQNKQKEKQSCDIDTPNKADAILFVLFTSNFVGIVFARSLHLQFQSWYYLTLPFLAFQIKISLLGKLAILLLIENVWNQPLLAPKSAAMMLSLHLLLMAMLFFGRSRSWSTRIQYKNCRI